MVFEFTNNVGIVRSFRRVQYAEAYITKHPDEHPALLPLIPDPRVVEGDGLHCTGHVDYERLNDDNLPRFSEG